MHLRHALPVSLLLAGLGSAPAYAQYRCDCTSVVDTCSAEVGVSGRWVEVTTDTPQCSRVDYFVDGQPFVSLVIDGEDRQPWVAATASPRVIVQSCAVCRDSEAGAAAAGGSSPRASSSADGAAVTEQAGEPAGSGAVEAIIEVPPGYPESAAGAEGYVDVEVTVGPRGEVQDASVASAQPPGVFDDAALAAVRRWRYPEEPGREPVTVTERIEFRPTLEGGDAGAPARIGRAGDRDRNACVRQSALFNYGERVEVGLLNACDAPLMVYGCAEGAEQDRGRWACTTSEQQRVVLVPGGDERVGTTDMLESGDALESYTYADRFFVSRAPNAEYWWLACDIDDENCRSTARLWARSMDGQVASVDPQGRSSLNVARSY